MTEYMTKNKKFWLTVCKKSIHHGEEDTDGKPCGGWSMQPFLIFWCNQESENLGYNQG